MVKFMIIFHHPGENIQPFEGGYVRFLGMVEQIPNITRRQVVTVLGSPEGQSPYYRILELYFEDEDTMRASLNSEQGQAAGAGLYKVFKTLGYTFDTAFAEIYEEDGGSTPNATHTTQESDNDA
jgi:hypothetical protein